MPRKVFTAGEILTAADVNTNLMDQTVMVFADSTARGSAIPSPTEGMITYLEDTDAVEKYDGSSFVGVADPPAILQVLQTIKTDVFSASVNSGDETVITGLTSTITPSSTSSKILVTCSISGGNALTSAVPQNYTLFRDATAIGIGDSVGSRSRVTTGSSSVDAMNGVSIVVLDAPSSTSAITYSVKVRHTRGSTDTVLVNRQRGDTDSIVNGRAVSTITVMEVAG